MSAEDTPLAEDAPRAPGFPVGRALASLVVAAAAGSGLMLLVAGVDTVDLLPGHTLCVFRNLTGIPCPGCGMTRAILRLGQLRFRDAVALNPFSPFLLAGLAAYVVLGRLPMKRYHSAVAAAALVAVLALWVARIALHK